MKVKKRLDVLLTEQGYADTRTKAQAIIMSGLVYVDGQILIIEERIHGEKKIWI